MDALLARTRGGDARATSRLFEVFYETLRQYGRHAIRRQRVGHTLQGTALLHDVYIKLRRSRKGWNDRGHFLLAASLAMRCALVDRARRRGTSKRCPAPASLDAGRFVVEFERRTGDVIDLSEAIEQLARTDPIAAQIIDLHYFGNQRVPEISGLLGIPRRTVQRRLKWARLWLRAEIS